MEYQNYPCEKYLLEVLTICPNAAYTYILLWKFRENTDSVRVKKALIRKEFNTTPTLFRNQIISLFKIHLLTYMESEKTFMIYLIK